MRRWDEKTSHSAFVPRLSINRSSESLHDCNTLVNDGSGRRAPANTSTFAPDDHRREWRRGVANSSTVESNMYTNRHHDNRNRCNRSSSSLHNGRLYPDVASSAADWMQPNGTHRVHICKDEGRTRGSDGNKNFIVNNRDEYQSGAYAHDTNFLSGDEKRSGQHRINGVAPAKWSWNATPTTKITRVLRQDAERHALSQPPSSSLDNLSVPRLSSTSISSNDESTLFDIDAEPVVPAEVLRSSQPHTFAWAQHPCHTIVLSLLRARGLFLPQHIDLVEYHMPEIFLQYISLCCCGAYFIRYQASASPKERFFSVRMLPRDATTRSSERIPCLIWTVHRTGVQVVGCVPLEQLVGITVNVRSVSFRSHLTTLQRIKGPRVDGRRTELSTDGAFSLWFFDRHKRTAKSVDLLTCNTTVLDVWTKTFKGFLSVNSSSVVQMPLTGEGISMELNDLTQVAQQQVSNHARRGSDYH